MCFAAGLLFNFAILLFEKASIQEKYKNFKHNTQIVFLDNYEALFSKTCVLQQGYFLTLQSYCLKRPRFKRNAKTLNTTHKLFFLTIMKHYFLKHVFCSRVTFAILLFAAELNTTHKLFFLTYAGLLFNFAIV